MKMTNCCVLLFISIISFGQTDQPFKGANVILIETETGSDEEVYISFGQLLINNGYTLEINHRDFLQLRTAPIETSQMNLLYTITASVYNGIIRVRIDMKINTRQFDWYRWDFLPGTGTVNYVVFKNVIDVFKEAGVVKYSN